MGKFNKREHSDHGSKFGGGKRFGGDRGFGGRGDRSEKPEMHQAICAECGRKCEVPFRPSGDKPVFCSDCFGKKEGGSRFDRRDSGRPSFGGDKKMFEAVCDKCHKSCEVPFRPTGDKPVFCSDCFGKGEKGGSASSTPVNHDQYRKQFEMLNAKLDNILKMLPLQASAKKVVEEEKPVAKEGKKEKPAKKVKAKKVVKVAKKAGAKKKKK
jgi:CxxC-x17-CxxC domain-containing protein